MIKLKTDLLHHFFCFIIIYIFFASTITKTIFKNKKVEGITIAMEIS